MKRLVFIVSCLFMLSACQQDDGMLPIDGGMVEMSFSFGGDYVNIEETPLTRAFAEGAKTLYAVQIYKKEIRDEGTRFETTIRTPYAYGLFDRTEDIRIALDKDNKYIVNALIIAEREDVVYNREGHYSSPFTSGGLFDYNYKEQLTITNQFVISDETEIQTDSKFTGESNNSGIQMARLDRYYGSADISPSANKSISIQMERYAFAFTYNVTPPTDGTLKITLPSFGNRLIYEVKAGDNQKSEQIIYNAPFEYREKDASKDVDIVVTWERGSNELTAYGETKTIAVKRKMNYNININMNGRDGENVFDLNMDDEQFTDETVNIN